MEKNFFTQDEFAKAMRFPAVHYDFWKFAESVFRGNLNYEYLRMYAENHGESFTKKDWCKRFKKEYFNNGEVLYQAYDQISIQNETINKDEEGFERMNKRIKELEEMCERYSKVIDLISDKK